ncbi:hypothetical protein HN681_00380 [archaeon]|jgi:hypothetical protein|nr:hypothetical protein [archaeon]MBT3730759.1 hypothetical protein [archaeon]MBT4669661.1 hypothetical protein [archaeon]MBT5030418.1 hypothetical protein [archaeon]MBT5288289.1 hypothetical protein [archaeon]
MSYVKVRGKTTFRFEGLEPEDVIKFRRGEDTVTLGIPMLGEYRVPMGIEACVDGEWVDHPSVFRDRDNLLYFRFNEGKNKVILDKLPLNFAYFTEPLIKSAIAAGIYGKIKRN